MLTFEFSFSGQNQFRTETARAILKSIGASKLERIAYILEAHNDIPQWYMRESICSKSICGEHIAICAASIYAKRMQSIRLSICGEHIALCPVSIVTLYSLVLRPRGLCTEAWAHCNIFVGIYLPSIGDLGLWGDTILNSFKSIFQRPITIWYIHIRYTDIAQYDIL